MCSCGCSSSAPTGTDGSGGEAGARGEGGAPGGNGTGGGVDTCATVCDDGNECTIDVCDPASPSSTCEHKPAGTEVCAGDRNECHPALGLCINDCAGSCVNRDGSVLLDGAPCGRDGAPCGACHAGTCVRSCELNAGCNDNDECTVEYCHDGGMCVYVERLVASDNGGVVPYCAK
jgi:hypothetical protein